MTKQLNEQDIENSRLNKFSGHLHALFIDTTKSLLCIHINVWLVRSAWNRFYASESIKVFYKCYINAIISFFKLLIKSKAIVTLIAHHYLS